MSRKGSEVMTVATTRSPFDEMTDDARWQAVLIRDAQFDNHFVYAVGSTGIYCRPACASKRPHRKQVRFFPSAKTAGQAGFRPCRRCRPDDTGTPQAEMVQRACRWLEENTDGNLTLAALGRKLNVSRYHLQRVFKRLKGVTPRQYAELCRLTRVKARLRDGENVTDALYNAGYGSSSRLYERAKTRLGMTPDTYRRGGRGVSITYDIVDCPLGRLLVGATGHGVCSVGLGDSDAELEACLVNEFPNAEIQRHGASLHRWIKAILAHINSQQNTLDLPVDIEGTDFQRRVWDVLRLIPYGRTRTYSQVACLVGKPSAPRAVARACAANPTAIVVPCHRVIRKDGGLGGYRWGIERKEALLEREQRGRTAGARQISRTRAD